LYDNLLNQVIEAYTPQLATMLAFIFSDKLLTQKIKQENKFVAILAITISCLYVFYFCSIIWGFHTDHYRADQVIKIFESIRPKTSFLTTGMIAYYFASRS